MKIWCRESMFNLWGETGNLVALFSFILNIFTHFVYCCSGEFLYLLSPRKRFLFHLPTLLVTTCKHVAVDSWIRESMIAPNMGIYISFKVFRYCTTIGKILVKLHIHWPKMFYQYSIFFYGSKESPVL